MCSVWGTDLDELYGKNSLARLGKYPQLLRLLMWVLSHLKGGEGCSLGEARVCFIKQKVFSYPCTHLRVSLPLELRFILQTTHPKLSFGCFFAQFFVAA